MIPELLELFRVLAMCAPATMQPLGSPVSNPHWLVVSQCSQEVLPIETARDHFGVGFDCVLSDQDVCEREAVDLQKSLRCLRMAAQYGREARCP
jgi:hypothetical protein